MPPLALQHSPRRRVQPDYDGDADDDDDADDEDYPDDAIQPLFPSPFPLSPDLPSLPIPLLSPLSLARSLSTRYTLFAGLYSTLLSLGKGKCVCSAERSRVRFEEYTRAGNPRIRFRVL